MGHYNEGLMGHKEEPGLGAIVLCGGDSVRMGTSKAWLDFDGLPLLVRVVNAVAGAVDPLVVSAAAGQVLPELGAGVRVVRDSVADAGPLQGLADGLAAIEDCCTAAFVCGCDAPFVTAAYVERLAKLLGDCDAVVPVTDGRRQPLSAVYRVSVLTQARELLAADRRSMMDLLEAIDVRTVGPDELFDVDPGLNAVRNLNTAGEYRRALKDWRLRNNPT